MKATVEELLKSDGVSALASGIDACAGGTPVASIVQLVTKQFVWGRDALFVRKVAAFIEEIATVDTVLLGQTVDNLRREHGEDYFNEALFNAIEKSDSVLRSNMVATLLKLCCSETIHADYFWRILYPIQNLLISDLKKLSTAIEIQERLDRLQASKQMTNELYHSIMTECKERLGLDTYLRYQACGITIDVAILADLSVPPINIPMARKVVECYNATFP